MADHVRRRISEQYHVVHSQCEWGADIQQAQGRVVDKLSAHKADYINTVTEKVTRLNNNEYSWISKK